MMLETMKNYLIRKGMILCVREVGKETGKTHYHALFHHCRLNTLRAYLKRFFVGQGNGIWSVKKVDDVEGFKRYMLKGTQDELADVTYNVGINIVEYHDAYWSAYKSLKSSSKVKKPRNTFEAMWADIEDRVGSTMSTPQVKAIVLRWFIDNLRLVPNGHMMGTYVNTIICRVNEKNQGWDKLGDVEMAQRLYPFLN